MGCLKQAACWIAAHTEPPLAFAEASVPRKHYLTKGWRRGLEPGPNFDGTFLYTYFQSAGFDGPPALTYIILKSSGWPTYPTRDEAEVAATRVRRSGFFDAKDYAARVYFPSHLDPALHYVIVGEQTGHAPSRPI